MASPQRTSQPRMVSEGSSLRARRSTMLNLSQIADLLAVSDATRFGEVIEGGRRIEVNFELPGSASSAVDITLISLSVVAAMAPTVVLALTAQSADGSEPSRQLFLPIHALTYLSVAPGLHKVLDGIAQLPQTAPEALPPLSLPVVPLVVPSFASMDVFNRFVYTGEVPVSLVRLHPRSIAIGSKRSRRNSSQLLEELAVELAQSLHPHNLEHIAVRNAELESTAHLVGLAEGSDLWAAIVRRLRLRAHARSTPLRPRSIARKNWPRTCDRRLQAPKDTTHVRLLPLCVHTDYSIRRSEARARVGFVALATTLSRSLCPR